MSRDESEVKALENINLEIPTKKITSILGPSGCGKTTLIRILEGLTDQTEGRVSFQGSHPKDRTGYVFQHFALFPWRNVEENVKFPLEIQKLDEGEQEEIVDHYLSLVDLSDFKTKSIHELSGGMKQRVAIARALAQGVPILLMDEPFGALDEFTRRKMQNELLRIQEEEHKTVVFVTHSIEEAVYLSDRIVLMSSRPGKIKDIVEVNLGDNRYDKEIRAQEEFVKLKERIWEKIKDEDI